MFRGLRTSDLLMFVFKAGGWGLGSGRGIKQRAKPHTIQEMYKFELDV